jgi:hypothetical protein
MPPRTIVYRVPQHSAAPSEWPCGEENANKYIAMFHGLVDNLSPE